MSAYPAYPDGYVTDPSLHPTAADLAREALSAEFARAEAADLRIVRALDALMGLRPPAEEEDTTPADADAAEALADALERVLAEHTPRHAPSGRA